MKERDLNHLKNMIKFADRVVKRIEGIPLEEFLHDEEKQDLILYPLGQLGEKAGTVGTVRGFIF